MANEQPQQPAPIIEDVKRANCPVVIGQKDENGNRELSFIVGPLKLNTFVISEQTASDMVEAFSGGIKTATLLDVPEDARG